MQDIETDIFIFKKAIRLNNVKSYLAEQINIETDIFKTKIAKQISSFSSNTEYIILETILN